MAVYRVRILEIANRDLDRIIGWVSEQSPDGAARLLAAFERLLRVLAGQRHVQFFAYA